MGSTQLGAGGDGIGNHQQIQLFLTVFGVDSGDQHTAGLTAHHLAGRQVSDTSPTSRRVRQSLTLTMQLSMQALMLTLRL